MVVKNYHLQFTINTFSFKESPGNPVSYLSTENIYAIDTNHVNKSSLTTFSVYVDHSIPNSSYNIVCLLYVKNQTEAWSFFNKLTPSLLSIEALEDCCLSIDNSCIKKNSNSKPGSVLNHLQ